MAVKKNRTSNPPSHLKPQIPMSYLDSVTWANYNKAIKFYEIRYNAWKTYMEKNLSAENMNIEEFLVNTIQKEWRKISASFWNNFNKMRDSGEHFTEYINDLSDEDFYNDIGLALLKQWVLTNPRKKLSTFFGDKYELYVTNIMQKFVRLMSSNADNITDNLIADFIQNTGNLKSTEALRKGEINIRPDIIIGANEYQKKNGVLYANGIAVELQGRILLDTENIVNSLEDIAEMYNTSNLFGFSVKSWSQSDRKEFTQSSVLKKELDEDFLRRDDNGSRHAWEKDYINAYMMYKVSNNIINLIGPTNIGLITGNNFHAFHYWLQNHFFYMQIQVKNVRKDKKKGMPSILNNGVYVRDFIKGQQIITTKIAEKKYKENNINYVQMIVKNVKTL